MNKKIDKWMYYFEWIAIVVGIAVVLWITTTYKAEASDNITIQEPKEIKPYIRQEMTDEWSSQIIYDTMIGCYEGTLRWILISNPGLIGVRPGPQAQRQMLEHCFCVLDKIRKKHTFPDYLNQLPNTAWLGQLYMSQALACVDEHKTLPKFFTTDTIKVVPKDNETTTEDNELDVKKEESEDSQEQLPSEESIESEVDSKTIFQG